MWVFVHLQLLQHPSGRNEEVAVEGEVQITAQTAAYSNCRERNGLEGPEKIAVYGICLYYSSVTFSFFFWSEERSDFKIFRLSK